MIQLDILKTSPSHGAAFEVVKELLTLDVAAGNQSDDRSSQQCTYTRDHSGLPSQVYLESISSCIYQPIWMYETVRIRVCGNVTGAAGILIL